MFSFIGGDKLNSLNLGSEILYLTKKDCIQTEITNLEVIQYVEEALRIHGKKELDMPAKIGIHPLEDSFMHAMPAYIPEQTACGMKWASGFPDNRKKYGLPQISALVILNDHQSGLPVAIMDGTWITTVRTAAVTAVGVKCLGNKNSETFGMIGCGELGKKHIELIQLVLPNLKEVYIFDRNHEAMNQLITEIQPKINATIKKASSLEELVKSSSIITSATVITATPQPQIRDEWIMKGHTLFLCDLHTLYEHQTINRGDKYFVDSLEQNNLFYQYGYYPDGLPAINGELGEVVAGLKVGRQNQDELIINNNIGMAVEDIVLGKRVFERALAHHIGQKLPL